jgi:hypothetical protein
MSEAASDSHIDIYEGRKRNKNFCIPGSGSVVTGVNSSIRRARFCKHKLAAELTLLTFESGASLFQKRACAFSHVVSCKQPSEELCFKVQGFFQLHVGPTRNCLQA